MNMFLLASGTPLREKVNLTQSENLLPANSSVAKSSQVKISLITRSHLTCEEIERKKHDTSTSIYILQEICCAFGLSRERWCRKSVFPSTGAGCLEHTINEQKAK